MTHKEAAELVAKQLRVGAQQKTCALGKDGKYVLGRAPEAPKKETK